jgi:S-adenosylmethionine:tRNA ribosyltransferase-isomerase
MNVSDFDFHLPAELVAQEPAARGESRLLVIDRATGHREHRSIADLPAHLAPGDLLVVNDTRVFPARLLGHRVPSGGAVECLLLGRVGPDGESRWEALMHPGQKLRPGERARFASGPHVLMAEILERKFYGRRVIKLWSESDEPVEAAIDALGHVPLPPYIHRPDRGDDRERYQTVYARARGSVAAPTAGLHFTDEILAALDRRGVERVAITLHVGYGTFKPVRAATVEEHTVDPEPYEISDEAAASINAALDQGRRIVAVGTTTTRALEDAGRAGHGRVRPGCALAEIFIYPGVEFRVIRGLVTNFHLPQSSLLMLVSAFAGRERILEAYRDAVERRYRFYSYGDAMLIV